VLKLEHAKIGEWCDLNKLSLHVLKLEHARVGERCGLNKLRLHVLKLEHARIGEWCGLNKLSLVKILMLTKLLNSLGTLKHGSQVTLSNN